MPPTRTPSQPWHHSLTLDLLLRVLANSIFHPFVASLLPLCLSAVGTPFSAPAFKNTVYWAIAVCLYHALAPLNERLADGPPRHIAPDDEVVVVTGGARGLGRCIAQAYALRGTDVAVLDIAPASAVEPLEGESVRYYQCDVGDRGAVKRAWRQITKELGPPTVLVHCAAIVHGKTLQQLSADDVQVSFRTNVLAQFTLNKLFLKDAGARPAGGTLVTLASVLGRLGAARCSAYAATKAALAAHHASVAAEHPRVKMLLVAPGELDTELFAGLAEGRTFWQRFAAPVLDVTELAMAVVRRVGEGRGGVIAQPAYARWIWLWEVLPRGAQQVLRRLTGIDREMEKLRNLRKNQDVGVGESVVLVDREEAM